MSTLFQVNISQKQEVMSKKESALSVNFKLLIEEGYKRLDVQRALTLSHGKLDLGRRLLSLAKEEHGKYALCIQLDGYLFYTLPDIFNVHFVWYSITTFQILAISVFIEDKVFLYILVVKLLTN